MDRETHEAIAKLRTSAARCGYPLDHLSDDDVLDGVTVLCHMFIEHGQAAQLIAAGNRNIGVAFSRLWTAAAENAAFEN